MNAPSSKWRPEGIRKHPAFTLVELLVVIVIVVTLAAVGFTLSQRMMKKGSAAKAVMNMRQIGSVMGLHVAETAGYLPNAKVKIENPNGSKSNLHWHQALMTYIYPNEDTWRFDDRKWWALNKPIFHNPQLTDKTTPAFAPWYPGFAFNMQINRNLTGSYAWGDEVGLPGMRGISINGITEPQKTPLIAPGAVWYYSSADLVKPDNKLFLVDGKLPILFVDGHVETMKPQEYVARKLDDMPKR